MKLQISFDGTDLDKAVEVATQVAPHADLLEIGSVLLHAHGVHAVERFRQMFPDAKLVADAKIVDQPKDTVTLLAKAGADWITVMAGTSKDVIHAACTTAHALDKKVMIDLLDAGSPGQSALEAKSLGGDALLYHKSTEEDEELIFLDKWNMVKENTALPIFLCGKITPEVIPHVIQADPYGLILGSPITQTDDPIQALTNFKDLLEATPTKEDSAD